MSSFTKQAIKKSFIKLLESQPLSKITVKDIVEDCGVNRNSFYYHFQNIPALLEEVVLDEADKIVKKLPKEFTLEEGLRITLSYVVENKKFASHIWNSEKREFYEMHLMRICEYTTRRYIESIASRYSFEREAIDVWIDLLTCEFFGQAIAWINQGMSYDIVEHASKICRILKMCEPEIVSQIQQKK